MRKRQKYCVYARLKSHDQANWNCYHFVGRLLAAWELFTKPWTFYTSLVSIDARMLPCEPAESFTLRATAPSSDGLATNERHSNYLVHSTALNRRIGIVSVLPARNFIAMCVCVWIQAMRVILDARPSWLSISKIIPTMFLYVGKVTIFFLYSVVALLGMIFICNVHRYVRTYVLRLSGECLLRCVRRRKTSLSYKCWVNVLGRLKNWLLEKIPALFTRNRCDDFRLWMQ